MTLNFNNFSCGASIKYIWDKVFKSGLSKFCRRQSSKNLLSPLLNTLSNLIHLLHVWNLEHQQNDQCSWVIAFGGRGKLIIPNQWRIFEGAAWAPSAGYYLDGFGNGWYTWEVGDMSGTEDMCGKWGYG